MPKLKFKAAQLAPLAVCLPLPHPLTPCVFPPLPRTVTIQLDLKFDYKIPSTKCAIGKHFSTVRARVFGIFSGQPTILAVFLWFFFPATVRNCNGFQIVFCLPLICWPCHRETLCVFAAKVSNSRI